MQYRAVLEISRTDDRKNCIYKDFLWDGAITSGDSLSLDDLVLNVRGLYHQIAYNVVHLIVEIGFLQLSRKMDKDCIKDLIANCNWKESYIPD